MASERRLAPVLTIAGLAIFACRVPSQSPDTRQTLEFSQKKVRANMQELEERMFRLSELLRSTQPDSSARLVIGLKRSREDLIVAEMDDVRSLISGGKLEEAAERQRVVLVKLEELRRLLLASDLDLMLKLERLRQLTRVNKSLAELKKEEDRQAGALEKIAEEPSSDQNQLRLSAMQEASDEAARKLEEAQADVKDAMKPESGVADDLDAARKDLDAAKKDLSQNQAKSAAGRKRKVGSSVGQASDKVGKAREDLIEELQDPIRAAVIDALNQMIQHQEKVNAGLPAANADAAGVRWEALRDLERGVVDLARSTRDLVEETEFSVALPSALRLGETFAAASAGSLAARKVDSEGRRVDGRLLDDLNGMLKILTDEAAGAKRAGRPSEGGCKGCADRNKLISELSLVRLLEVGLREDTGATDARRTAEKQELAAELQKTVRALAERQTRTSKVTDSLRSRSCSKCLGVEHE